MSYVQQAFKLVKSVTIGPGSYVTSALDLRGSPQMRIVKINSIMVRATSVLGTPLYDVNWSPGAQSNEFQSNLPDVYGPYTVLDGLDNVNDELLHVEPMISVYAPFVRFQILTDLTSPADCVFDMWALCQERFDV